MARLFGRKRAREEELRRLEVEAARGRSVIAQSREIVLILDERERLVAASKRALQALDGLELGSPVPDHLLRSEDGVPPARIPIELDGRRETVVYVDEPKELPAYEELRTAFTAAVSHELRTPVARLLALLESALLPDTDGPELINQARAEVEQIRELIDDILFLSELETGRQVVSLTSTPALPVLRDVTDGLAERARRAGMTLHVGGNPRVALPVRPRMLRVIAENLAENAIRYAGPGARFELSVVEEDDGVVLRASDDGSGVAERDLPRLFERFYRGDRSRASRGTGLGLAIVKHIVTAAGGSVTASGGPGRGLEIRCSFAARSAQGPAPQLP